MAAGRTVWIGWRWANQWNGVGDAEGKMEAHMQAIVEFWSFFREIYI